MTALKDSVQTSHLSYLKEHLKETKWHNWSTHLAAADCSYRSYWRAINPEDSTDSVIIMVAPPELEDVRPFIHIDQLLRKINLHAPEIFFQSESAGILVLEDLGENNYRRMIESDFANFTPLYDLFNQVMIHVHKSYTTNQKVEIALYTEQKLWNELEIFLQWYCPNVGIPAFDQDALDALRKIHKNLVNQASDVPQSLVLRDAMIDNFIFCPHEIGLAKCGILDFQDALWGPITYDLASMYHDARFDIPIEKANYLLSKYLSAFPRLDKKAFVDSVYILSTLRNLKILGVFTRMAFRNAKPQYLQHIPRIWRWIDHTLTNSNLIDLKHWLNVHCPVDQRITPLYDASI